MHLRVLRSLTLAYVVAVPFAATTSQSAADSYPVLTGGSLESGRAVWLENCLGCHGDGTAGAPRPSRYDEWEARIAQKREVLYQHAIEGFFGPDYAMMPPRGGNEELTDAEVMAAVDYMLGLVEYLRQNND